MAHGLDIILRSILTLYLNLNSVVFQAFMIFTMKVNGQWVPCVHNISYSFIRIILKQMSWPCFEDVHVVLI